MKKHIISLLALVLLLSPLTGCNTPPGDSADESTASPSVPVHTRPVREENPAADFEYTENSENAVTITKYIGKSTKVVFPETIDGKAVTQIDTAWDQEESAAITSVKIPDTVTLIADGAFGGCSSLETVVLSENLIEIADGAFEGCSALASITLPPTLTRLGYRAFAECTSLKHVTVPKTVTDWGGETFVFSGLETFILEDGIETVGECAFAETNISEVVLPQSVQTVEWQAFAGCDNLASVTLNEGLVTIEDWAFAGKSELTEVVIPKTVESITERAFGQCSSLKQVKFEGNAPAAYVNESSPLKNDGVDYIICYREGAEGFTSPEWFGYKTELWQ